MAHDINIENGKAAFFSLRESAWHGLGQVVQAPVSDDKVLELAGLGWQVEKQPLYRSDMTPITDHVAIVRMDTQKTLGIVGKDFTPIQNDYLINWFRALDGFADVTIETAGALGDGETVWVLARCKGLHFDLGGDEHQGFMSMTNGHAGNRKLMLTPTMIRQVCANTTRMITQQKRENTVASGWELRHTANIVDNLERIRELYARTTKAWAVTEEALRMLAKMPASDEAITRLATEPWVDPKRAKDDANAPERAIREALEADERAAAGEGPDETERVNVMREMRIQSIRSTFESPTCTRYASTRGTLFAAYNAVTEYLDHDAPSRVQGMKEMDEATRKRAVAMKRFESANFGGHNDKIKARAFKLAMELAGASA